jgi:PAS domain S-box-containing protein
MLSEFLEGAHADVTRQFEARVVADLGLAGVGQSALGRWLPSLLDDLDDALRQGRIDEAGASRTCPTAELRAAVREHELLHDCVLELLEERGLQPTVSELRLLHRWFRTRTAPAVSELLRREQAMCERSRRLSMMLDSLQDGAVLLDLEGRLLYVNPAAAQGLYDASGTPPGSQVGKNISEVGATTLQTEEMAAKRERMRAGESFVVEYMSPSARGMRWRENVGSPVYGPDGQVEAMVVISRDVHDRKIAAGELAQALAFRERVITILGHDLRNPLSAVEALAQLSLSTAAVPEPVRAHLRRIDQAARRMDEMVGTLLDFARSREGGSLPVAPEPMDFHEVCRRVVDELTAAQPGRSVELVLSDDGWGHWDPARLAQVVSNLVGNALLHGEPRAPVHLSVEGVDDEIVLRVTNRGPAIAPDVMTGLFQPFHRGADADELTAARGLGLGLYIVRQIVVAHGGNVAVESTATSGTTFTVRLPRQRATEHRQATRA